jgi:hypothetical protein
MIKELLDNEGYPTQECLKFIEEYKGATPIKDFLLTIEYLWWHSDMGFILHEKYRGKQKLELHTGGWSGNESIIEAILSNFHLTHVFMKYVMWKTGGHYYFIINQK